MADPSIQPAPKNQDDPVKQYLTETEFHLAVTNDVPTDISNAIKLPLSAVPALGTALASLPDAARTAITAINVPTLLTVTDKLGNPIDPTALNKTAEGLIGSFRDSTSLCQARFHQVAPGSITAVTTMPYNPTELFMAAAIAQVNIKLDAIQATVDEMFSYVRKGDKSAIRGNVKVLETILCDYAVNCGNSTYMANAHMKVLDIKQRSLQDLEKYGSLIKQKLGKKSPIELRPSISKRLDRTLDYLKDCQLSLYTFSFATFLDPMLARNFNTEKLKTASLAIEEESIRYRELYTCCYDAIEAQAKGAVDSVVLDGIAHATKSLGEAVEKTTIGELTPIDEGLNQIGEGIGSVNEDASKKLVTKLHNAKSPELRAFMHGLKTVDRLHNRKNQLAIDKEAIYILPANE